jgi:hypothetical protein
LAIAAVTCLAPIAVSDVAAATDSDGDGLTNSFELHQSHTDPNVADTDHNGILDGDEDPDHDGLTNLWEQRLRLNPLRRDTDGDGVRDGAEDADHDGLTNAFEARWGVSDPRVADTDGDGLLDSAEDPDGDGLSNLGEQRFGTSPANADTDGDGTPDGSQDSDHNGTPDGLQQDQRPVPSNLKPSLADAPTDRAPSYFDGCHVRGNQRVFRHCVYGNAAGTHTVALFGDSHAAQWLPALISAAHKLGWKVVNLTRSACPSADVTVWSVDQNGPATWCNDYRRQAIKWLERHPPDVVILSNFYGVRLFKKNGQPIPAVRAEQAWAAGLGRTLDALPKQSHAIVLADTPYAGIDVPACLQAHPNSIAACERPRARNVNSVHAAVEATAAAKHGAAFADLLGQTCSYDPCPVVVGHVVMWSDGSHMTATFSRVLAPSMRGVIQMAIGG